MPFLEWVQGISYYSSVQEIFPTNFVAFEESAP